MQAAIRVIQTCTIIVTLSLCAVIATMTSTAIAYQTNLENLKTNEDYQIYFGPHKLYGPERPVIDKEYVRGLIITEAQKHGVDVDVALRIAACESQFDHLAQNPNSTAKGVYQFLDGTWEWIGGGDVYSPRDNIMMFMVYYKRYPEWWVCT